MLHPEAMRKYKLFRHPFINDVTSEKDVFLSEDHRYIQMAMMDAAIHTGFIAVVGEVQSGKTIMRHKVVQDLMREGDVTIIFPRAIKINVPGKKKNRVTPTNLCNAIIRDISSEQPRKDIEEKVRQVEDLLKRGSNQGRKYVLMLEEAQNLTEETFKYLKQFHELEDGFKKLLGIILIGQPELKDMLDETKHVDLREVIRRIQVAEIRGLNGSLKQYLEFKFKRINAKLEDIFTEEAIAALSRRLSTEDDRRRKVSLAYPGLVNNYVVKAINLSYELAEDRVTEEVVNAI